MKTSLKHAVLFFLAVSLMAGFMNINIVQSASTILYVDPPLSYHLPGESFTADIKIKDVTLLSEWQANISFDPAVLTFVNITDGDFFTRQGLETTGFEYLDYINEGWFLIARSIFGQKWATGSGTLATIEFTVNATGESKIDLVEEPVWQDTNGDGIRDPDELIYMTHLIRMNPVPPGGSVDIIFTAKDGLFFNLYTPPTAEFTFLPINPGANQTVSFDASNSSTPSPRQIVEYHWDFGDGTTAAYVEGVNLTNTATHAFTQAGPYNVSLTVVDNTNITGTLIETMYNTTEMPRVWFELHSTTKQTVVVRLSHDVAVVNVVSSTEKVAAGGIVTINVTVANMGFEPETFSVSAYYDDNLIETKQVTNLASGAQQVVVFEWDTTDVDIGDYQIFGRASGVTGETNLEDNEMEDGTVEVQAAGQDEFPLTLVVAAVAIIAILAIIAFLFMRRRAPAA